jgi:hypothetical protein
MACAAGVASIDAAAVTVSSCNLDSLRATDDSLLTAEQRVLKYAPALRFTSNEPFFPTLPFFTAFDGVNNGGTGSIDFEDPEEIAPWDDKQWVWSKLRDRYARLSRAEKLAVAAVFYRVRPCSSRRVMSILKSDGTRYYRLDDKTRRFLAADSSMDAYEYYFYYVNDFGIKGHPEDIESFFVFVPRNARFLVLVGAAHSDGDANNVAIYEWPEYEEVPEIQAFVELGGHAMAPDVPPPGELYRHGFDTNWHVGDAWGIRDVIAMGGGGSLKRYEGWKTETRDELETIKPVCDREKADHPHRDTYFLVSADRFFGARGAYGPAFADTSLDVAGARAALRDVLRELPLRATTIASVDRLSPDGLERLRSWRGDGIAQHEGEKKEEIRAAERHIVTRHGTYTAPGPTTILKPYLFGSLWPHPFVRRSSGPDGGPQLYVGAEVTPLFLDRVQSWLNFQGSIRIAGSWELNDEQPALDLGYFTSTARRFTEYLLVGTNFPDYHIGGGFIFRTNPRFIWGRATFMEFRGGVMIWHEEDLRFSKPSLEFSVAVPWGGARH